MERLQSLIPQIEDLGRDGFPYLEGARARTELQLKECIRKIFGEKSPEYDSYRKHRVSVETPADTKQTVAFIKSLLTALEDKKLEIQGLKPPAPAPLDLPSPTAQRPQLVLVPPAAPIAQVTIAPSTPVTPPPVTMAVAVTTNLDLTQAAVSTTSSSPLSTSQPAISTTASPQTAPAVSSSSGTPQPPVQTFPGTAAVGAGGAHASDAPSTPSHPTSEVATPVHDARPSIPHKTDVAQELSRIGKPTVGPLIDHPSPEPQANIPMGMQFSPQLSPTSSAPSRHLPSDPLEIVKSLCARFHLVARQLRLRGEYRATLDVEDEFDVQDLIHALLRLHFDDVATTEWVPSYANGAPRIIFLLNDGRLAVAVKKTRTGLNAKDLADQLRLDIEHCRTLKRCSTLLCFVYDPEGRIGNPRGLEADLMSISDQLTADVYVAPK
jgi:hypothetical protein